MQPEKFPLPQRFLLLSALAALSLFSLGVGAVEPPGLARVARSADKATATAALAAAGLSESCKAAMTKTSIHGLHCRLVVAAAAAAKMALVKDVDVDARAAVVSDALAAAEHIASWVPTEPEPGLRRSRFEAHRAACDVAFAAVADFEAMPSEFPGQPRARTLIVGVSTTKALPPVGLRDNACACASRTINLAVGADASSDEQATVQGVLTRNRCLLASDSLKIAERKDPSAAFSTGNEALRTVANASSSEGRLVALAASRLVEMARCTNKHVDGKRVKDKVKLGECACGVVKHWSLPLKKEDARVTARLPLLEGNQLLMPVTVEGGVVASCGEVEGPLLAP